eukprot:Clim_evm7s98 gene=Clim_evmTU7s98
MMNLSLVSMSALLVGMTSGMALPDELPTCPPLYLIADELAWEGIYKTSVLGKGDNEFEYIMKGDADMQPLAKIVSEKATDFEEYMEGKIGNFVVLDTNGHVDPFYSMLWKLNALTAPILMAPYWVDRTEANEEAWDEWWDAIHDLAPSDEGMENHCFPSSEYLWYKPWAISFPTYDRNGVSLNNQYRNQTTVDYATTRVWEVVTNSEVARPDTGIYVNTLNQCVSTNYAYSETIVEETGASADHSYESSTTNTREIEIGASASGGFLGMEFEVSTTITSGLEQTAARSATEGTSQSLSFERSIEFEASPLLRRNSILNVTVWADQTAADVWFTGDIVYDDENAGIQAWIQGDGIPRLGDVYDLDKLVKKDKLATPAQIKKVVRLAMGLIGAEWSDAFVNSLVSPSVRGIAHSLAGNNIFMEMWECDRSMVPDRKCDEALAAQYPPSLTCEVGVEGAAASAGEGVEGIAEVGRVESSADDDLADTAPLAAQAILDHLDTDCYTMAPVSGSKNRWQISLGDNC